MKVGCINVYAVNGWSGLADLVVRCSLRLLEYLKRRAI